MITSDEIVKIVNETNALFLDDLEKDYTSLGIQLERDGLDINELTHLARNFSVAIPSWGLATGGTRFARFPLQGDPRNIFEKIEDASLLNLLTRANQKLSIHLPWDQVESINELASFADYHNVRFDSVNSNTFQDNLNSKTSYKFGSLTHSSREIRNVAIHQNLECIEVGKKLGCKSITIWIPDGSNYPGQQNTSDSIDRYLESTAVIYKNLPQNWDMLLEHKLYEPAFYSTVNCDWGTSLFFANSLGSQAKCLIDLGHHAPNTNIEVIVAKLIKFKKLGGFHFNDSSYGDDDLDSGSVNPFRLFLIFNEISESEHRGLCRYGDFSMTLDQSHNITDSIESLAMSTIELLRAYLKSQLVNRKILKISQDSNDPILSLENLKKAYRINVDPIIKMSRYQAGGSIEPLIAYRRLAYRDKISSSRPQIKGNPGIV
jgi:L-rhamnose isomerase/sugar isomerase